MCIRDRYTDLIEPLSLDEAYLDVTADTAGVGSATAIAEAIRTAIREELNLSASAGVSYNKFIAKVASDQNKPDGVFIVRPGEGAAFVAALPARRFYGVGPKTAERMAELGIHTGADIRAQSRLFLTQHFGKSAEYLFRASRGEDDRPVRSNRERKSIGAERTYSDDLIADDGLRQALEHIIDIVWERISKNEARGRTVTLKVKFADFQQITRARSVISAVSSRAEFEILSRELLEALLPVSKGIRLLGLTLSGLEVSTNLTGEDSLRVAESAPLQKSLEF